MPTNYPVDSTYHQCCNAIGRHARDCVARDVGGPAHVPAPADATEVHSWTDNDERRFWSTDRDGVLTGGYQQGDGTVSRRRVTIEHNIGEMTAAEARSYAARLSAAADEVEMLTANDRRTAENRVTIATPGQTPVTCLASAIGAVLKDQLLSDEVNELLHRIHSLQVAAEDGRPYAEHEAALGVRVDPTTGASVGS